MRSDIARTAFGINGAGVMVGTLSDSYNCLGGAAAGIASGDLPTGTIIIEEGPCIFSDRDEGRAMIEIIHDVAPGARHAFHTAHGGQANFAQGILALAGVGANVINDDITYLFEPFYQDGIIAQAVDLVKARGVTCVDPPVIESFSSAGGSPILFDTAGDRLPVAQVRQQPDIAAPDGVSTVSFGTFFGTSASASHAAGVAALMKDLVPTLTPDAIYAALKGTAIDMDDPSTVRFDTGFDFGTGFGLIQADAALNEVAPEPEPIPPVIPPTDPPEPPVAPPNPVQPVPPDIPVPPQPPVPPGQPVVPVAPRPQPVLCRRLPTTIVGTEGSDIIIGTPGRDVIHGLGGNDVIRGGGGNDVICGGAGRDRISGGPGRDRLFGDSGSDRLDGGTGRDRCWGGGGADIGFRCEALR